MKKIGVIAILSILSTLSVLTANAFSIDQTLDTDNDGLTDYEEKAIYQTFWDDADTDKDGFKDGEEVANGYSPWHGNRTTLFNADTDGDGLNDLFEIKLGTNVLIADTDGDGFSDGHEVNSGYSPTNVNPVRVLKVIKIDIDNFLLSYYQDGIELDLFLISSGQVGWETPRSEFTVLNKLPIKNYFGYPNTPYNLEFTFNKGWKVYIHQARWHNNFGIKNV